MLKILIMIATYFHDLAVAMLASNILVVYFLGKWLDQSPEKTQIMQEIFRKLTYVTYGAFAYVIIGGVIRAMFFMEMEWNPAVGKGQIAALVVKHVVLVSVTIIGIISHTRYVRKYGKR